MIHSIIHIGLHLLVPLGVSRAFFKERLWQAWCIMMLTMVVDLDHLLANPIYDPHRCSINYHPLHSYPAILIYCLMAAIPKMRLIGLGLIIHMALDGVDCIWMKFQL
jgi:hypothetical protein